MKKYDYFILLSILTLLGSVIWFVLQGIDKMGDGKRDIELGNFQSAIDKFTEIIQTEPDNAEAYNNLGVANHHLKNYDLAIDNYTKAIALNPEYNKAFGNRGISKNDKGDFVGALADYSKVIELKPGFADYYNNRGLTNKNLKHYMEAIRDFEKAHELSPQLDKAVGNLTLTYKELGNCDKVIAWCTYYVEHYTPRKIAFRLRAECKEQTGDIKGAKEDYDLEQGTINQLHPDEPKPYDTRTVWNIIVVVIDILAFIGIFLSLHFKRAKGGKHYTQQRL